MLNDYIVRNYTLPDQVGLAGGIAPTTRSRKGDLTYLPRNISQKYPECIDSEIGLFHLHT